MTGRERIEQAAKENGWSLDPTHHDTYLDIHRYIKRWRGPVRVAYRTNGAVSWSDCASSGKNKAGQVIAYLQQHKETYVGS